MNNQARICNLKCKYNVQGVCSIYGDCMAKDLFISELEKINKEILSECPDTNVRRICMGIINKHIKENKE